MFQAAKHNVYIEPIKHAMSIFTACSTILHVFRITKASLFFTLFYFIYIAQQNVLKTFSSVKIMTRILARTVTRMTGMACWLAPGRPARRQS